MLIVIMGRKTSREKKKKNKNQAKRIRKLTKQQNALNRKYVIEIRQQLNHFVSFGCVKAKTPENCVLSFELFGYFCQSKLCGIKLDR